MSRVSPPSIHDLRREDAREFRLLEHDGKTLVYTHMGPATLYWESATAWREWWLEMSVHAINFYADVTVAEQLELAVPITPDL